MSALLERLAHQLRQVKAAKERLDAESQALASILAEVSETHPEEVDSSEMMWRRLEGSMLRDAWRSITAKEATAEAQGARRRRAMAEGQPESKKATAASQAREWWLRLLATVLRIPADGYMRY